MIPLLVILGAIFCVIGFVGTASGASEDLTVFVLLGIAMFIIAIIVHAYQLNNSTDRSNNEKTQSDRTYNPRTPSSSKVHINYKSNYIQQQQAKRDLEAVLYQRVIERFNTHYDLGLYDGDIHEISRNPSPYEELAKYVPMGTPSLEESYQSLKRTGHMLSHGIGLDDDDADDLDIVIETFIDELYANDDIEGTLDLYKLGKENCTIECLYLVGKIDYFAIILGFLDYYASETDNEYLKNKCQEILKKHRTIL
jgi:hypothetical protein